MRVILKYNWEDGKIVSTGRNAYGKLYTVRETRWPHYLCPNQYRTELYWPTWATILMLLPLLLVLWSSG